MADKQSLNATFFAFRKRERGGVLLGATVAYMVIAFGVFGLFAFLNWQAVQEYFAWSFAMSDPTAQTDPSAMMPPPAVMAIMPLYFLISILTYVLLASYEAACLRWMIRGEAPGLFGLTLGWDTWRVWFGYWIWFFLFLLMYLVIVLVSVGLGVGVGVAMSQGDGAVGGALGLAIFVVVLALLIGWLWISVRLAPAAAASIARKRFAFFDAWKISKGRFWGLLGAFLLPMLMYLVLCIVVGIGFVFAIGSAFTSGAVTEDSTPSAVMNALFATPTAVVVGAVLYGALMAAVMTLYVALFGVNARAALLAIEEGKISGPEA